MWCYIFTKGVLARHKLQFLSNTSHRLAEDGSVGGGGVSTGSDMSRNTALALTIPVVLVLIIKQSNSNTAVDSPIPEILPTISSNLEEERKAKFLVSAVTTTTTLSTFTICYTAGTLTAPCKKKKREIPSENEILDLAKDETIQDGQSIDR